MQKAISAHRRRGLMWFDQRHAAAGSPNASGRASESRAQIHCQAQAADNKSLALSPATLTSSGATGLTSSGAIGAMTAASVPGRLRGDFSSNQTHSGAQADRNADGLVAGQAALVTGQAQITAAARTTHAAAQHAPSSWNRVPRPYAPVDRHMGGTNTHPDPSTNYSQFSNSQRISQQRSTNHRNPK